MAIHLCCKKWSYLVDSRSGESRQFEHGILWIKYGEEQLPVHIDIISPCSLLVTNAVSTNKECGQGALPLLDVTGANLDQAALDFFLCYVYEHEIYLISYVEKVRGENDPKILGEFFDVCSYFDAPKSILAFFDAHLADEYKSTTRPDRVTTHDGLLQAFLLIDRHRDWCPKLYSAFLARLVAKPRVYLVHENLQELSGETLALVMNALIDSQLLSFFQKHLYTEYEQFSKTKFKFTFICDQAIRNEETTLGHVLQFSPQAVPVFRPDKSRTSPIKGIKVAVGYRDSRYFATVQGAGTTFRRQECCILEVVDQPCLKVKYITKKRKESDGENCELDSLNFKLDLFEDHIPSRYLNEVENPESLDVKGRVYRECHDDHKWNNSRPLQSITVEFDLRCICVRGISAQ